MKRSLLLFSLSTTLAVFGLQGCGDSDSGGGSLCSRSSAGIKKAFGTCESTTPGMPTMMTMSMGSTTCSEEGCTAADKMKISEFLDCVEKLAPCEKGKEVEFFINRFAGCAPKAQGISAQCGKSTGTQAP